MTSPQKYTGIGLMSGTSLDGVDIAYCEFIVTDKIKFKILEAKTQNFPSNMVEMLRESINFTGADLAILDNKLGVWIGEQCLLFIDEYNITPDFIASHGHTVFHQPDNKFTLQIGNGNIIHSLTNIPVVFDFRSLDVALGGQGAPMVPIGDELLFPEYDICMNLGGFANISFHDGECRRAYDVCAVNIVLNSLAEELGVSFDPDGQLARSGKLLSDLHEKLDTFSYYNKPWPKSLGKEWVELEIIPVLNGFKNNKPEDLLHTYTKHAAKRIAHDLNHVMLKYSSNRNYRILTTGGGTYNQYLMENIKSSLSANIELIIPNDELISFKEALVFALMGLLRIRKNTNCLSSVTGASRDSSCGVLIGI